MKKCLWLLVSLSAVALAGGAITVHADETFGPVTDSGALPFGGYSPTMGDEGGYYFWDSTETSSWAPVYGWFAPQNQQGWHGDDTYWTAQIPFNIRLCGTWHLSGSDIYIGSNGIIGFISASMDEPINQDIPQSASPNSLAAILWDNLNGYTSGDISLDLAGTAPNRRWFITYSPWYFESSPNDPLHFQIVIHENDIYVIDNTIVFRYKDVDGDSWRDHGFSATVGLENGAGSQAAKYSYNENVIPNYFAIKFVDSDYVDDQLGSFSLLTPEDEYVGVVGEVIHFTWEESDYSGHGTVNYTLVLADNPNFNNFQTFPVGGETEMDYVFGSDDTGWYWWKVRAKETHIGLERWSEEVFRFRISGLDVEESTWGQIKASF